MSTVSPAGTNVNGVPAVANRRRRLEGGRCLVMRALGDTRRAVVVFSVGTTMGGGDNGTRRAGRAVRRPRGRCEPSATGAGRSCCAPAWSATAVRAPACTTPSPARASSGRGRRCVGSPKSTWQSLTRSPPPTLATAPRLASMSREELAERLRALPADQAIIAYCRGPYCVYADDTVGTLRAGERPARRLSDRPSRVGRRRSARRRRDRMSTPT